MGGDFSFTPLGSLVDETRGISYGVVQPGQHVDDGVPIVRVTDIRHGRINQVDPLRVAPEIADKYRRTVLRGGELLLTLVGTVGETAVVPASLAGWNTARAVAVLPVLDEPGPRWVQYALQTGPAREYIQTRLNTTVQATLNLGDVTTLPIPLPPRGARRRILSILGTLDDKIELNRKMNATAESMARALFKSWFVDFDPVRARAEGRAPSGMDAETAKLFPCEFVESELGTIPKSWRATTLGTEVERCGGAVQTGPFGSQLHASDYVAEGVPVVMPKDIGGRRVSTASIARVREVDAARLSRHRLQPGDVVYSRRGDVERHALIGARETGWLCGTGCLLVRLGPSWPSPMFASFALDRPETRAWISQHAIGATMPNLNSGILSAVPLVMPSDDVLRAFARAVDPLQALVVVRDAEAGLLAKTRDELLPRLLSGELLVDAAERELEAVA
jgi:type I restriction enzyme S subunit